MTESTSHRIAAQSPERAEDGIDRIFCPRSIAILGVTTTPGTVPYDIFVNILDSRFNGVVYPVAPRKRHIAGVRAYDYVLDIPDPVDLAVLVFPGSVCEQALRQCAEKGIRAAVIISAGFREVGASGAEREKRIQAIAAESGMRLIGPNCLGVINTHPDVHLNASFARNMPAQGRIAFLSQSGALCTAVLDYAAGRNLGFSKFVSFGNKADVDEVDLLNYLASDPETSVILMYLEDINRGRALISAARRIAGDPVAGKPILAIKSGRTAAGAAAAQSHTGALATEDDVCEGVFKQSGIIRCATIEDMFNAAQLLVNQTSPVGDRLAIITNAGGPGVMATDAAIANGLRLAQLSESTTAALKVALPAAANIKNPIDVIGDAHEDRYAAALDAIFKDESVDQILVILTPQSMTDIPRIAQTICRLRTKYGDSPKTLACSFMGGHDVAPGVRVLDAAHIPHYILPEAAVQAMARTAGHTRWLHREVSQIITYPVNKERVADLLAGEPAGYLAEPRAIDLLKEFGLPVSPYRMVRTADEAAAAANELGYPVVLRIVSEKIIHKFEVNGVILNLPDEAAVRSAFTKMRDDLQRHVALEDITGILVRPMIDAGKEVILGVKRDPVFGPIIMFGLGGIYVEAIKDVTFRVAPIRESAAGKMVRELRASSLLQGIRGEPPSDLAAIEDTLRRLSQMAIECERIAELDINPLIVHPKGGGVHVADVRIRLSEPTDEHATTARHSPESTRNKSMQETFNG